MSIFRDRTVVRRSRALTLISLTALVLFALLGLPHFIPAKSAAPLEAPQALNWTQTGLNTFNQTLIFRQLVVQGPRIWAATDGYGILYTDNGGQLWGEVMEGLGRPNRSTKTILPLTTVLWAGTTGGVYKCPLNNLAMIEANNGLQFNGLQVSILYLKANGTDLLAGTTNTIYKSTDNGVSWTRVSSGIVNGMGIAVLYSVGNAIYAGSDYNGVYKSTDAGTSWTWMSNGLVAGRINAFLQVGNVLLAGAGYEGVWRSTNGAESWEKIGNGLNGFAKNVHDFIMVGSDIYAATDDGVYRSTDVGVSWEPQKAGLTGSGLSCNTLAYLDNTLYVGTEGGGMYKAALSSQPTPTPTPTPGVTPTPTPTQTPTPTPTVSPTPTPTPSGRVVQVQSGNGLPGSTVTLSINLTALGNENTVGFSLNFDPAVLSYQSSAKGSDATSILKNELSVAQGRVGLAATVDQGQSFPAGARQLATATFTIVASTSATSTAVTLNDQPIPRQVVGADAGSLTAGTSFLGGTISIQNGYEGDVTPRPTGKNTGLVNLQDFVQTGRFAIGLDTVNLGSEFQRADCAPRATKGDGAVNLADYVQAGRFATGTDPVTSVGGPTGPTSIAPESFSNSMRNGANPTPARSVTATIDSHQSGASSIRVAIDALGDESAVGWSLNFNPGDWRFVSASNVVPGAQLALNTDLIESGRLGLAILLKPGATLGEGSQELVELHFEPARTTTRALAVGFADRPVSREVVNRVADALPGRFTVSNKRPGVTAATIVSAADFSSSELSAESLATAFGTNLSTQSVVGDSLPLPTDLAGTTVLIRDSLGVERKAGLLFVSPSQINYEVPANTANGVATVEILRSNETSGLSEVVSVAVVGISTSAPALFSAASTGVGWASALSAQVDGQGTLSYSPVAVFDHANEQWTPNPIDLTDGTQTVYLVLFGTGLRGSQNVRVFVGGEEIHPMYSGAQGTFAGLDQINLAIPRSLAGAGEVEIRVETPGESSNVVHVVIH